MIRLHLLCLKWTDTNIALSCLGILHLHAFYPKHTESNSGFSILPKDTSATSQAVAVMTSPIAVFGISF